MSNLAYCRFENTSADLEECLQALYDNEHKREDFSDGEKRALKRLIACCKDIIDNFENEAD